MPTERPSSIQNPPCSCARAHERRQRSEHDQDDRDGNPVGTARRAAGVCELRRSPRPRSLPSAFRPAACGREARATAPPCRRPRRRRRPCRSGGRCRRRRRRATASARSRACPPARARAGRRASVPTWSKSTPACCGDAVHEHVEGRLRPSGSSTWLRRFHALYDAIGVRRTALATLVTSLIALVSRRRSPTPGTADLLPGEAALAERAPHPQRLHLRLDLHRRDLPRSSRAP